MTDIQLLNAKANGVKTLMQQLSSSEFGKEADPEFLHKKFLLLQKKFGELTKVSNAGKATPELRAKLKTLKKWYDKYADTAKYPSSAEVAISGLPKKYLNKNVVLDAQTLKQISHFKIYIVHVFNYMQKLDAKYRETKETIATLMEKGKTLQTHMDKFIITEDHIPSYDYFAADDEEEYELTGNEPEVAPTKMVSGIQTILNKFHQFSIKVTEKYQEVASLAQELDDVDLGDFFNRTNQRNKLIKQLLHNLSEINGLLYQGTIPGNHALREQYYQIVENCAELLPDHIASRLLATIKPRKNKGKMQSALERSLQGIDKYDPAKDPGMKFQSPHVRNYVAPAPFEKPELGPLEDRIDRKVRHQELSELPQKGEPLTSAEKTKYENLWNDTRQGEPLSPEDKEKYEKLWNTAQARKKMLKIARYYQSKI